MTRADRFSYSRAYSASLDGDKTSFNCLVAIEFWFTWQGVRGRPISDRCFASFLRKLPSRSDLRRFFSFPEDSLCRDVRLLQNSLNTSQTVYFEINIEWKHFAKSVATTATLERENPWDEQMSLELVNRRLVSLMMFFYLRCFFSFRIVDLLVCRSASNNRCASDRHENRLAVSRLPVTSDFALRICFLFAPRRRIPRSVT